MSATMMTIVAYSHPHWKSSPHNASEFN